MLQPKQSLQSGVSPGFSLLKPSNSFPRLFAPSRYRSCPFVLSTLPICPSLPLPLSLVMLTVLERSPEHSQSRRLMGALLFF